jgi:hypothetical protein
LAARGPTIADMAACADLLFAGSQAVKTKFHDVSPVLIGAYHSGILLSRNFRRCF